MAFFRKGGNIKNILEFILGFTLESTLEFT